MSTNQKYHHKEYFFEKIREIKMKFFFLKKFLPI